MRCELAPAGARGLHGSSGVLTHCVCHHPIAGEGPPGCLQASRPAALQQAGRCPEEGPRPRPLRRRRTELRRRAGIAGGQSPGLGQGRDRRNVLPQNRRAAKDHHSPKEAPLRCSDWPERDRGSTGGSQRAAGRHAPGTGHQHPSQSPRWPRLPSRRHRSRLLTPEH